MHLVRAIKSVCLVLVLCLVATAATRVQSASHASTTSPNTLAYSSNTTAGDLLVVVIGSLGAGQTVSSVTDTQSNTWQQAATRQLGSNQFSAIWFAQNTAGGADTVTVTMGTSTNTNIILLEYSGMQTINAMDQAGSTVGSNVISLSPVTTAVAQASEVAISGITLNGNRTLTAATGFSVIGSNVGTGTNANMNAEDQISTSFSGNVTGGFSWTSNASGASVVATFKATSGGGGSSDIYISQTAIGSGDGSNCANAKAASFFNASAIGGNTYHMCGIFSGTAGSTMLTIPSGSVGSTLKVVCEPGSSFVAQYWGDLSDGAITIPSGHHDILIDGQNNCTISNYANGDALGNQKASSGIAIINASNVEVRNLTINHIYDVSSPHGPNECSNTTIVNTSGVTIQGSASNINIHNLTVANAHTTLQYEWDGASGSGVVFANNTVTDATWGIQSGNFVNTGSASLTIHDNDINVGTNWQNGPDDDCHTDGVFIWGHQGNATTATIYNNYIHGDFAGTAQIACSWDGIGGGTGSASQCTVFNNVIVNTLTSCSYFTGCGPGKAFETGGSGTSPFAITGPHSVYNNTMLGVNPAQGLNLILIDGSVSAFENNLVANNQYAIGSYASTCCTNIILSDYNLYNNLNAQPFSYNVGSAGTFLTFPQWQARGFDSHGVTGNPLLDANFKPQTGSAALGTGTNLTSLGIAALNADKAGNSRPATGAWDIGAYQLSNPLPIGLTLTSAGLLSGTPTTPGTYNFTVKVTDSLGQSATQPVTIVIQNTQFMVTNPTPPGGLINTSYGPFQFTASGGVNPCCTWTSTGQTIPGLALSSSGMLTGTPTQAGNFTYSVQAKDAANNTVSSPNYTISISSNQITLPQAQVNPLEWVADLNAPAVTENIKSDGSGNHPYTCAGIQAALADWAADTDKAYLIKIDPGQVPATTASQCLSLPTKLNATHFVILESSSPIDPNTSHAVICAGGMGPTSSGSVRNLGCANGTDKSHLYHLQTSASPGSVITTGGAVDSGGHGPSHIVILDAELSPTSTVTTFNAIAQIGVGSETTTNALPSHIYMEWDYLHGDLGDVFTPGNPPGNNIISTGWTGDCVSCGFLWNYVDMISRPAAGGGAEGHIFAILNNTGPMRITNNWLEGASSSVFCGGGGTPSIPGIVSCNDFEIRVNHFTYPLAWVGANWGTHNAIRKNIFENKEGRRMLIDGNEFDTSDETGGQGAPCMVLTVRNFSGGPLGDNYNSTLQDYTISNNSFHGCLGFQNDPKSGGSQNGGGQVTGGARILYFNNVVYDMDATRWCVGGQANTGGTGACSPYGLPRIGDENLTWTCTASRSGTTGNITLTCADGGTGFHQTNVLAGDPVSVSGCADATFNTGTGGLGPSGQPNGPPALTGTDGILTVVYNTGTTGSASTTGCTLNTNIGWWNVWQWSHNTVVAQTNVANSTGAPNIVNGCPSGVAGKSSYARSILIQDNLFAVTQYGGFTSAGQATEGSNSEKCFDTSTLTVQYDVWAERNGANYTSYPSGLNGNAAGSHLYFPATVPCATTTPNSACIGFSGMLTGTFNQTPASITAFELCGGAGAPAGCAGSSVFAGGQVNAASDGTDMGANIPNILAHQSLNAYPGFFPSF